MNHAGDGIGERANKNGSENWKRCVVWWQDLLWGFWNGLTAWVVLIVHVFGGWSGFPVYDVERSGNWYDFGFLLGAGSPFLGAAGAKGRGTSRPSEPE